MYSVDSVMESSFIWQSFHLAETLKELSTVHVFSVCTGSDFYSFLGDKLFDDPPPPEIRKSKHQMSNKFP